MSDLPKHLWIPPKESKDPEQNLVSVPLSLSAKLSKSYLHEVVLGLLLALVSLAILQVYVHEDGEKIKDGISKACSDLEVATNALASTPYFLAKGLNHFVSDSFEIAKTHATQLIRLTLTLLKDLFLYILFRYQKVLQCIIYFVITSGLDLASKGAQQLTDFVNRELASISTALDEGLQSINNQIRSVNDATSHLSIGAFGLNANVPKIPLPVSIPGISDNLQWTLPNTTASFLSSFSQLPPLSSLETRAKEIISAPFDSLINSISSSIDDALNGTDHQSTFNLLPLPSKIDSIAFCNNALPLSAVDKVISKIDMILWISISILICLIIFSIALNGRSIYKSHQLHQAKIDRLVTQLQCQSQDLFATSSSLHVAMYYPKIESFLYRFRIQLSDIQLWMLLYCSDPIALFCILVGAIGIFFIQMQVVLIPWIASLLASTIEEEISLAANVIEEKIGSAIDQAVGPYVTAVNAGITAVENALNLKILEEIKTIVGSIDSGVMMIFSSFQAEMAQVFDKISFLKPVVSSFFTCIVGNVSETLTTLESNLKNNSFVNISRITSNHFQIDASMLFQNGNIAGSVERFVQDSASPAAKALFQTQLDKFLNRYESILWLQTIPFLVIFLFGLSVVVCGAIIAMYRLFTCKKSQ